MKRIDPRALALTLGADIAHAERETPSTSAGDYTAEQIDLDAYPAVRDVLAVSRGDRSADTMRATRACFDAGLTLPQTRWAVRTRPDLAARLDEFAARRPPVDDLQKCWSTVADTQPQSFVAVNSAPPPLTAEKATTNGHKTTTAATENITHSGHLGMAIKLANQFTNKLLYVHNVGWHRWDGKRWAPDGDGAARRAVHTVIRRERAKCARLPIEEREQRGKELARYETAGAITGILTEAAVLEAFSATVADLDADPWLLNCANGTLDLHTLQLRPASPADRITKLCRGAYHPDAPAPAWNAFLTTVLPDEQVRGFVARLTGLALVGEVREHILPIFTGTGANGKGTFYKAVLYELDDYGCTAEADLFTPRENAHPPGQMDLLGRRFVVVSETDEGKRLAEATMKRLTGGDPITARYMRENFVTFTPSHLAILVTNHLPKVPGDDPAIWRRIRVVPFNVVIPADEQDKTLDAKLQLEADGILTWAVEGLRDYLAGGLAEPDNVIQATATYKTNSDAVARFIDEECHQAAAVKISAGELFDAWERWRKVDGADEINKKALGQALSRHGFASGDSNGRRWWHGICVLKTEEQ